MEKIVVYYIATNKYIEFFDKFVGGMKYFFPDIRKKLVLITDCESIDFSNLGCYNIDVKQYHIDHYYWPIPTLFKMFYIEKFFQDDCDYHFYCNANLIFNRSLYLDLNHDLFLMKHYWCPHEPIQVLNRNDNCVEVPEWSECYIKEDEIPEGADYVQGGFFGGKREQMKSLLKGVNKMLRTDLNRNVIPSWHDETYLNKYILKNYWIQNNIGDVKIIDNMPEYADLIDKPFDKYKLFDGD